MISLLVFFFVVFITFYIGFTRAEKKYGKLIGNDIYNRIIESKAEKQNKKSEQGSQ